MIAIDGITYSHPQPGGYRTYTRNLVNHLAQVGGDFRFMLMPDRIVADRFPENWRVVTLPTYLSGLGVVLREQVKLRSCLRDADLLHSPAATGPLMFKGRHVVTIHDTIEFSTPLPSLRDPKTWSMRLYSRAVQRRLARSCDRIITDSHYARVQIEKLFGTKPGKVEVVYLGVEAQHTPPEPAESVSLVGESIGARSFLLAIGSIAPRKNIKRLLEAYRALPGTLRETALLVVVCTHRSVRLKLERSAAALGISDSVRFLEAVSDTELVRLYQAARLFVFPSLEEGFGLPPLEAMACGTPTIASNTSSLPEVLGDGALLVPPQDTNDLRDAIEAVLIEPNLASELRARGLARSSQFSWSNTAVNTLKVYRAVTQGCGTPSTKT